MSDKPVARPARSADRGPHRRGTTAQRMGRCTHSAAAFSRCRRYRFALWRRWASGPQVLFVMLNPSTADEDCDDATIRRCIGFARSWGFGAMAAGNLFALRSTSPTVLKTSRRPVGRGNDAWLVRLQSTSAVVVAAWGN